MAISWQHRCYIRYKFAYGVIFSLNDISETATLFWKLAGNATVIAFHGEMGAGKTHLFMHFVM